MFFGVYIWCLFIYYIRLMFLFIMKKYMLENKGVFLYGGDEDRFFLDFDFWWIKDCE